MPIYASRWWVFVWCDLSVAFNAKLASFYLENIAVDGTYRDVPSSLNSTFWSIKLGSLPLMLSWHPSSHPHRNLTPFISILNPSTSFIPYTTPQISTHLHLLVAAKFERTQRVEWGGCIEIGEFFWRGGVRGMDGEQSGCGGLVLVLVLASRSRENWKWGPVIVWGMASAHLLTLGHSFRSLVF